MASITPSSSICDPKYQFHRTFHRAKGATKLQAAKFIGFLYHEWPDIPPSSASLTTSAKPRVNPLASVALYISPSPSSKFLFLSSTCTAEHFGVQVMNVEREDGKYEQKASCMSSWTSL